MSRFLIALLACVTTFFSSAAWSALDPDKPTVLITGSNRGFDDLTWLPVPPEDAAIIIVLGGDGTLEGVDIASAPDILF